MYFNKGETLNVVSEDYINLQNVQKCIVYLSKFRIILRKLVMFFG